MDRLRLAEPGFSANSVVIHLSVMGRLSTLICDRTKPDATVTFQPDDVTELVETYQWLFAPAGTRPQHWDPHVAEERLRRLAASPEDGTIWLAKWGRHRDIVGFCSVYLPYHEPAAPVPPRRD
jgi:hypothetical protein